MKLAIAVLLVVLIVLQMRLWSGPGGMRTVAELEQAKQAQMAENRALEARNRALAAEVEDLKSGGDAVEERARSEMGLVREGEVFFQSVDRAPAAEEAP
jgi:cell division protein FtsB